jgi:formamidopyrimidine-DNA glycosylase
VPELPEVETIRRQLEARVAGRTIKGASVRDPLLTQPVPPGRLARQLRGRRIGPIDRRGKYLLLALGSGDTLAVHLRMTGQLHWSPEAVRRNLAHRRAHFVLDDGSTLVYCDQRRFGRMWIVPGDLPDIAGYWAARTGLEPLGPDFTAASLARLAEGRSRPVKPFLLDQTIVAGIGNIYADEALFQAGVHPLRPAGSLSRDEVRRLHRAIRDRLSAAIDAGGSSIDTYRDTNGEQGAMQTFLRVHLQAGRPCPRCRTEIVKTRVAQRGTYLCPSCQEAPC